VAAVIEECDVRRAGSPGKFDDNLIHGGPIQIEADKGFESGPLERRRDLLRIIAGIG
jgi:hypothetical protein